VQIDGRGVQVRYRRDKRVSHTSKRSSNAITRLKACRRRPETHSNLSRRLYTPSVKCKSAMSSMSSFGNAQNSSDLAQAPRETDDEAEDSMRRGNSRAASELMAENESVGA
jgi:hypothetical protein